MTQKTQILIDNQGFLYLERPDGCKPCFCPYASPNMTIRCGDWCPQFGQPTSSDNPMILDSLPLHCTGVILKGAITDDRTGGNK